MQTQTYLQHHSFTDILVALIVSLYNLYILDCPLVLALVSTGQWFFAHGEGSVIDQGEFDVHVVESIAIKIK